MSEESLITEPTTQLLDKNAIDAQIRQSINLSFKQSEAYKALVAEIDLLKREQKRQGENHQKLWAWVKAIEGRLIRKERDEPEAKAKSEADA